MDFRIIRKEFVLSTIISKYSQNENTFSRFTSIKSRNKKKAVHSRTKRAHIRMCIIKISTVNSNERDPLDKRGHRSVKTQ